MKPEEKEAKPRTAIVNFERRRYPRFNIDLPVEYYRINSPVSHDSRAFNISEGGLLIYFPEKMELGQHLKMKLFFTSGSELNTIEMLVEVVWMDINLGKDWGDHRSGIRFIDISSENMRRLKNFLLSLSQ